MDQATQGLDTFHCECETLWNLFLTLGVPASRKAVIVRTQIFEQRPLGDV